LPDIPEGFSELQKGLGFNDAVGPVYFKPSDEGLLAGLLVKAHHLNPNGSLHGGVIATFCDMALSAMVGHHVGEMMGMATVNLNIDYLKAGREGEWLQLKPSSLEVTRTIGFASATLEGPEGTVARANATIKLPLSVIERSAQD
jgi:uncharacterized protein (TIGR00369 family)